MKQKEIKADKAWRRLLLAVFKSKNIPCLFDYFLDKKSENKKF